MMRQLLSVAVLLSLAPCANADIMDGLELYLKFDESQGRTATDSSGQGRDAYIANGREQNSQLAVLPDVGGVGTVAGATTDWYWGPTEGKFGGAFLTSGLATNAGTRNSPNSESNTTPGSGIGGARAVAIAQFGQNLNDTGSNPPAWSFSFWTKGAYYAEGQDQVGYFQGWDNKGTYPGNATTELEYRNLYGNNNDIETDRVRTTANFGLQNEFDNRINAGTTEKSSTDVAVGGGSLSDLQDGEWHHIAVIYDNNAWNGNPAVGLTSPNDQYQEVTLFVDGIEAAELRTDLNGSDRVALGGLVIGSNFTWKGNGGDGQYIDDFAVWNRALTAEEITQLSRNSLMNIPEPSTWAMGLLALAGFAAIRRRAK